MANYCLITSTFDNKEEADKVSYKKNLDLMTNTIKI